MPLEGAIAVLNGRFRPASMTAVGRLATVALECRLWLPSTRKEPNHGIVFHGTPLPGTLE